jgi:hypothetical protein
MKPKAKLWFTTLVLASGLAQAGDSYEEGRLAAAQEVLGFMYVLGPSLYPGVARERHGVQGACEPPRPRVLLRPHRGDRRTAGALNPC